jgi:RHS repeat-associated protein
VGGVHLVGLTGGTSASFQYDPLGRRRGKTVNGATTNFLYDGLNLVQELTGGGTPTANLLTSLGVDETFARTDTGGTSILLRDTLGNTLALADASGAENTSYTYEPFGATTRSGSTSPNAAQFTGRDNDGTGLYYYRARYYSPTLGRFVSDDPLGLAGGINAFTYVGNNPTRFRDALGLKPDNPNDDEDDSDNDDPDNCSVKDMLVTAYNDSGPGSDWSFFKPSRAGSPPRSVGPGTVAVANTKPLPYPYGSTVSVINPSDPNGGMDYVGAVHDTGAGWDAAHHGVPADQWIDIWLPGNEAKEWGKQWRRVKICS